MTKTKKKEVQKQGLRPSQKAKAEKLRKKQETKANAKIEKKVVSAMIEQPIKPVEEIKESQTELVLDASISNNETSSTKTIYVKNAEGDPDTVAEILIQNKIDYTPKVSVIMPVYNVEPYLRQCLDSVVNQTLKEIEIICVDDGSTDGSLEILKEYAEKDSRITIITQKNLYAGVARNAGLSQAKGEYLSFLDSDDFFEPNMLEEMYNKAMPYEADFCICHVKMYNMAKETLENCLWGLRDEYLPQIPVFSAKDIYKKIYQVNQGWVWDKIYNRNFVEKNGIKFQALRSSNDVFFNFCHLAIASKIVIVDNFLMTHRLHVNGSLENTREISYNNICNAIKKIQHYLIINNLYNDIKISFVNFAISNIIWNYETLKDPSKTFLLEVIHDFYENIFYSIHKKDYFKPELYEKFKKILKKVYIRNPKEYIPVVFATNKKYCLPCIVTIKSLIKHASKKRKYALFVLHSELEENDIKSLEDLNTKNVFVHCMTVDVEKLVGSSFEYTCAHYSKEMYYRILIPQLFGIYDKVVYLDCDIVLMKDIYDLYKTDIGQNVVAAVINPLINSRSYVKNTLNIMPEKYFNSGVLIINNNKFKELKIKEKCLEYLEKFIDLKFPDQDVLNMACQGYIYYLSVKWNYQWFFRINNTPLPIYCRKDYEEAEKDPYIIHYASDKKAWNFDDNKFTKEWRKYCRVIHKTTSTKSLEKQLEDWYFKNTKNVLNLDSPRTFNEKIQWLKLYDSTPIKTRLADKFLVRDWVKEKIGEEYLIPLLGVYDSFEEIDFDKLPKQFVIKCNHGSGYNIIVKDKSVLNLQETREKLDKWMEEDFSKKAGLELHYRNIQHKIIIEKYMDDGTGDLRDYKYTCFGGKPEFIWIDSDRHTEHKRNLYDLNWNQLQCKINSHYNTFPSPEKPHCLKEMNQLATILCEGFSYVRVDFYIINEKIYFGEMTFTSSSGTEDIKPDSFEKYLANKIKLPKQAYNIDTGTYYKPKHKAHFRDYLLFCYYVLRLPYLKKKYQFEILNNLVKQLTFTHINIKNTGKRSNQIKILDTNLDVSSPTWLTDDKGIGKFATGSSLKQYIRIKMIKDGKLTLTLKGRFRTYGGKHMPVWIDYKSIKIDGKEILSNPISTWHDKPFNYYIPVKDGQEITINIEQQYHKYTENELKDTILKLNPNSDYIKENINNLISKLKNLFTIIDEKTYKQILMENCVKEIINQLAKTHINIKNNGSINNSIDIIDTNLDISSPIWLTDNTGIGKFATGSSLKQYIKIKIINEGLLSLSFKGQYKVSEGKHLPVWIDYKSIKIDGKELLSVPVETWHDKPYSYKMPVKNGQEITLEIEQQYYQYTEDELKKLLIKLYPNSDYIKEKLEEIMNTLSSLNFVRKHNKIKIYAPDNYINIKNCYKLNDKLSFEVIKDGICVPTADEPWDNFYSKYLHYGYILDKDNKHVMLSAMGKQNMFSREDSNINIKHKCIVHKKAIYLGCFISQYGHFICQGLSRLWFLLDNDYKDYDLIYVARSNDILPDFMGKIISLFGINLSKLTRITEPTQYDEIIIPEVSFALYNFWTDEYKNTIDKIKNSVTPIKNDKIYLSRCHYKDNIMGEKSIEQTFADNGYKIIYPEELSVEEQIALISGADDIVASTGTIAHNLMFAKDGAKCAILERGALPNRTQPVINEMRNLDASYIMANYSILPVSSGPGPYILGINKYMQKYLDDNGISYNKNLTNEYLKYLLTYQYLWYKIYSNKSVSNALKIENSNISEDYLKTLLKGYEDMFSGKKIQIISDKNLRLK